MTTPAPNGIFDQVLGYVLPPDSGTWATSPSTWDDFTQWAMQPGTLIWATDIIDLKTVKTFNLKIQTVANGRVEYNVYTSDTGAFAGEETITSIATGDDGIPGFTGQYVWIEIFVYNTGGVNILQGVEYEVSEQANKFSLYDINTSTLGGTVAARQLVLPKSVASVTNIQITPHEVSAYPLDVYVTNTPTSTYVVPKVISKGGTPTFALIGMDNHTRDGVVDITVEYLPEGYMSGNNLLVR